jgi:WD40 repeat protein
MAVGNVGLDSSSTRSDSMFDDLISSSTEEKPPRRWIPRLWSAVRIIISIIFLFATGLIALPQSPAQGNAPSLTTTTAPDEEVPVLTTTPTPSPTSSLPSTATPNPQEPSNISRSPTPPIQSPLNQGLLILSISEGGYSHLFAYQPLSMPFIRLTDGAWDDITPALSPDGRYLAFASNRAGSWDLYMLDLASGKNTRLTDTAAYDASPSWSPDGLYLVYESYSEDLEVLLKPVFDPAEPIPLSDHPAADFSPAWSPGGRQIAFISDRTGEREVWLADLDKVDAIDATEPVPLPAKHTGRSPDEKPYGR